MSLFDKIKAGLSKTRSQLSERTNEILNIFKSVDEGVFEELEDILIMSDVGFDTSSEIIERLRQKAHQDKIKDSSLLLPALKEIVADILTDGVEGEFQLKTSPAVILVIGVNGVGKTTSIAKMANLFKSQALIPFLRKF